MGKRAFKFSLIGLTVLVLLSASQFPGALIGFFCGCAVAFFAAGPALLLASVLTATGLPTDGQTLLKGFAAIYAAGTAVILFRAVRVWLRGDRPMARLQGARAAVLLALPLMAYFSTQAMMRAWP